MRTLLVLSLGIALVSLVGSPAAAQQWTESGDAGDLPLNAQIPGCTGALLSISGSLAVNDADMYFIQILDNAAFQASTCAPNADFDTQLWLFNYDGNGVTANDDAVVNCNTTTQSVITGQFVPGPGCYYLAISRYNRDPVTPTDALIWNNTPVRSERAPDGAGAPGPVGAWRGDTAGPADYEIGLLGVSCCVSTPVEPATWGGIKSIYRP